MIVDEVLKILADHEQVEQLLVNDLELGNLLSGFRIDDSEDQLYTIARMERAGANGEVHRILDLVGNSQHQLHAAAGARAWFGCTDIGVHRADVIFGLSGNLGIG